MRRFNVLVLNIFFYSLAHFGIGQQSDIEKLKEEFKDYNEERIKRVQKYSEEHNIPILNTTSNGSVMYLKDVINGIPQFIATDNLGARATTGVDKIGVDGQMGLDLDGSGISIGIWDGGLVRTTHQELEGRVSQADGSTSLNFHATHVAGTILSKGIIGNAKGMATNATAISYDFADDDNEMLSRSIAGEDGIVISNHSYGTVTGWSNGSWYGDPAISDQEDYRFGFYTGGARLWDQIAYADQYYTIVKSAGNDRGDSGSGPYPPDGPYDIISTNGTAKNIITIGAVRKVPDYQNPEDVVMSSFSGWGPTDDGRIKPDFVAAGVGIYSTFETSDDAYGSLQGTSMSAPNAAGTFVLLQQLHKKLSGGRLMKSSSLKGLVAHTAREAGRADGPDYEFGWGLINAAGAADHMIKQNGNNIVFEEYDLNNGESISLNITPKVGTKVVATISWLDPPGTVPSASLDPDDLILVNDLDMTIYNEEETNFPWILDPSKPAMAATTGDNFRDNIEKIEFVATSNNYTLEITHKNDLESTQNFTLILSYSKEQEDKYLYWIGESDNQFSNPSNWSVSSGGSPTTEVPDQNTTLIFDNNFTPSEEVSTITLNEGDVFGGIVFLSENQVELNISSDVTISGNILTNENVAFTGEGTVYLSSDEKLTVSTPSLLEGVDVVFDNINEVHVNGDFTAKKLTINSGKTVFNGNSIILESLDLTNELTKEIQIDGVELEITNSILVNSVSTSVSDVDTKYIFNGQNMILDHEGFVSNATKHVINGSLNLGRYAANSFDVDGELNLTDSTDIGIVEIQRGATLKIQKHLELDSIALYPENSDGTVSIITSDTKGTVLQARHQKICLNDIEVSNVDFLGQGNISIGTSGVLSNSEGWSVLACDEVLFSDFTYQYSCVNSRIRLNNTSSGNFSASQWDIDGVEQSSEVNPEFVFEEPGEYTITLTISNGASSNSYSQNIEITENDLTDFEIVLSNDRLFSIGVGDSYQWYLDNIPIPGATDRTYFHSNISGEYFVVLYGENCNISSNSINLVVAGAESEVTEDITVSPNPTRDIVKVDFANNLDNEITSLELLTISGKSIKSIHDKYEIDLSNLAKGIYLLKVNLRDKSFIKKIIKE